jgi:hypothetical protein
MKLTIHNIDTIAHTKIDTQHANWVIRDVIDNDEYYTIKVNFVYGKTLGKKHPKHIYFQLYRDKTNDGYWILDSTETKLHRWGLYKGHLETRQEFIDTLKHQLDTL